MCLPETEFHFPRRATSISWACLGSNRSLRSHDICLQNFKLSNDRQKMIHSPEFQFPRRAFECAPPILLYYLPIIPEVCSDFLTLLAAWEMSRISVHNRFELDVCSQVSKSSATPFLPFFENMGIMGSAVWLPDSPMLVDHAYCHARLSFIQDFSVGISWDILRIFTYFVGWKTSERMEEFLN